MMELDVQDMAMAAWADCGDLLPEDAAETYAADLDRGLDPGC